MNVTQQIEQLKIIPVIKLENPSQDALPLAKALCQGGLAVAEITFRAQGAEIAIEKMRTQFPKMLVGAGTVVNTQQVDIALAAGAQFAVCPGLNPKVVQYCQKKGLNVYPGCLTPTEIEAAMELGLYTLKFFPAQQFGGIGTIKALCAPYPKVKFIPTGGIGLNNLKDYLELKNVAACGGSFMFAEQLIKRQNFDEIAILCSKAVEIASALQMV